MKKKNFRIPVYIFHVTVAAFIIASCSRDNQDNSIINQDSIQFVTDLIPADSSIIYFPAERFSILSSGSQVVKRSLKNHNLKYYDNFVIRILDGSDGATMVKDFGIFIDGKIVSSGEDLAKHSNVATKSIPGLDSASVLEVRLTGSEGQFIVLQIECKLQKGVVTDIDGNHYHTVKIGKDVWMSENLRTTRFNDSTHLDYLTEGGIWNDMFYANQSYYAWYNDDVSLKDTYGALYNIYAVAPQDNKKNLCPTGWHVAQFVDFWDMIQVLEPGTQYVEDVVNAGSRMKEAGNKHWNNPNIATNDSGFTALPGGVRYESFSGLGLDGSWWLGYGEGFDLRNDNSGVNYWYDRYDGGHSVRCVKDGLIPKADIVRPLREQH